MATCTPHIFAQALLDAFKKKHDISADTLKAVFLTSSASLSVNTSDPYYTGGSGTTDLSSYEIATGTAYTGPFAVTSQSWTLASNIPTFAADDITLALDSGGGVSTIRYIAVYNDTDANKRFIFFGDYGSDQRNDTGQFITDWNGTSGDEIFTMTPA